MQMGLLNLTAIQYETATVSSWSVNTAKCLVVKSVQKATEDNIHTLAHFILFVLGALQLTNV